MFIILIYWALHSKWTNWNMIKIFIKSHSQFKCCSCWCNWFHSNQWYLWINIVDATITDPAPKYISTFDTTSTYGDISKITIDNLRIKFSGTDPITVSTLGFKNCQLTETPGTASYPGNILTSDGVTINDFLLTYSVINIQEKCEGPFTKARCFAPTEEFALIKMSNELTIDLEMNIESRLALNTLHENVVILTIQSSGDNKFKYKFDTAKFSEKISQSSILKCGIIFVTDKPCTSLIFTDSSVIAGNKYTNIFYKRGAFADGIPTDIVECLKEESLAIISNSDIESDRLLNNQIFRYYCTFLISNLHVIMKKEFVSRQKMNLKIS